MSLVKKRGIRFLNYTNHEENETVKASGNMDYKMADKSLDSGKRDLELLGH